MKKRRIGNSKGKIRIRNFLLFAALLSFLLILTPVENPLSRVDENNMTELMKISLPSDSGKAIHHPDYWLLYNDNHGQASWVASVLTAERVLTETVKRSDRFIPDPDVIGCPVTSDYSNSGFDRGHILSFASNGWSQEAGDASFYLSNMSPQYPNTNRYTYERLEEAERSATVQNGVLLVVHGPVLSGGPYKKIGKTTEISVPDSYFVCFLDYTGEDHKAIGFIIPNDDMVYTDIGSFAVPVNKIEDITGFDFWPLIPDGEEEKLENMCNPGDWDLSKFSRSRLAKKYGYDLDNLTVEKVSYYDRKPANPYEMVMFILYKELGPLKRELLSFFDDFVLKTAKIASN